MQLLASSGGGLRGARHGDLGAVCMVIIYAVGTEHIQIARIQVENHNADADVGLHTHGARQCIALRMILGLFAAECTTLHQLIHWTSEMVFGELMGGAAAHYVRA